MALTRAESDEWRCFLERLCRAAGTIQLQHFRCLAGYERKGAIDLLTIADQESEAALVGMIRESFPGHRILAEEGGEVGGGDSDYLWVIDPLDGTTNYAHGIPLFAVSVALQHAGTTIAGGVLAPAIGDLYLGTLGHGATRNGEAIHVSQVVSLNDALLVTGFPYDRSKFVGWLMGTFGRFLTRSQGMLRLGAAALDMSFVASGCLDGFYEANLHPWDIAAGALLIEEEGGRVTDFAGRPFHIHTKRMACSNGRIHGELLGVLGEAPLPD
ncbi:inositol monophosphatase [Candidatus Poribacteria bacterium]|nr:inositol monophosphatase [Candidatus Poribacteria bacterium]